MRRWTGCAAGRRTRSVPSGTKAPWTCWRPRDASPATTDPASVRDTALDVAAALRLIPPEQRAALVLVDMLGYPVADAAAVLGNVARDREEPLRPRARATAAARRASAQQHAGGRSRGRKREFHGTVRQPAASHLGREETDEASFGACGRERPGRAQRRADQRPPRNPDRRAPGGLPALRGRQCWAVRRACPAGVRSAAADARSGDFAAGRGDRRRSSGPVRCGDRPWTAHPRAYAAARRDRRRRSAPAALARLDEPGSGPCLRCGGCGVPGRGRRVHGRPADLLRQFAAVRIRRPGDQDADRDRRRPVPRGGQPREPLPRARPRSRPSRPSAWSPAGSTTSDRR